MNKDLNMHYDNSFIRFSQAIMKKFAIRKPQTGVLSYKLAILLLKF